MNLLFASVAKTTYHLAVIALALATSSCDIQVHSKFSPSSQERGSVRSGIKRNNEQPPQWQVATYNGLILGQSTASEVEQVFGKPLWVGPPEEKLIDDETEEELLYEYTDVGGIKGQTTIVLGARTKIIKAIDIYPKQPVTLRHIVTKYGNEYVQRESKLGPCPTQDEVRNFKPGANREYPLFLVYPHLGMYVSLSETEKISHIGYLANCS